MAHVVAGRPLAVMSVAFAVAWVACVGDDPGTVSSTPSADGGAPMGERLGACFPDGKCKEGLVCRDGAICLSPDEPTPVDDAGNGGADAGDAGDAASGSDGGDGPTWTCDDVEDCVGGLCCVVVGDQLTHATSHCAVTCEGTREICATNGQCSTGSCKQTSLTTSGGDAVTVFLCD